MQCSHCSHKLYWLKSTKTQPYRNGVQQVTMPNGAKVWAGVGRRIGRMQKWTYFRIFFPHTIPHWLKNFFPKVGYKEPPHTHTEFLFSSPPPFHVALVILSSKCLSACTICKIQSLCRCLYESHSLLSVHKVYRLFSKAGTEKWEKTLLPNTYTIDFLVTRLKLTPLCSLHAQKCETSLNECDFFFHKACRESTKNTDSNFYACAGPKRYHSSVHMEGQQQIFGQWINRVWKLLTYTALTNENDEKLAGLCCPSGKEKKGFVSTAMVVDEYESNLNQVIVVCLYLQTEFSSSFALQNSFKKNN